MMGMCARTAPGRASHGQRRIQRLGLAVVPLEQVSDRNAVMPGEERAHCFVGAVGRAVVDDDDLQRPVARG
jgi:hypothetical protein